MNAGRLLTQEELELLWDAGEHLAVRVFHALIDTGVKVRTVAKWCREGSIPAERHGGHWYVLTGRLRDWRFPLAGRKDGPSPDLVREIVAWREAGHSWEDAVDEWASEIGWRNLLRIWKKETYKELQGDS